MYPAGGRVPMQREKRWYVPDRILTLVVPLPQLGSDRFQPPEQILC